MDWGYISNKLNKSKGLCLCTISSGRLCIDHSSNSVAFPKMVQHVIENACSKSNFNSPFPKYFERPKTKVCQNLVS